MKRLFENWRKHLNEELLVEVSFEDARQNLWKAAKKIISGYYYDKWGKPPEGSFKWTSHISAPSEWHPKWRRAAEDYEQLMIQTVPRDLEDNQRGSALLWLIRLTRKDPSFREDVVELKIPPTHLSHLLELFFQNQRFMEEPDINKIKSRQELETVVGEAGPAIKADQEKRAYADADAGTEILRDDAEWKVAIISNKGAACELGKGTDWCTAAPGLDYFAQYYSPNDPLFFLEDRETGQRFQFHYGSRQFMDHNDYPVDEEPSELFRLHAVLVDALGEKIEQYPKLLKQSETWKTEILLSDRNSPPEELKNFVDKILASASGPGALGGEGGRYGYMIDAAKHPNTPPETLTKIIDFDLQSRQTPALRYGLTINAARNPNTPVDTLDYLANANIEGNGGISIRLAVATNPSVSRETLTGLSRMTDRAANTARKQLKYRRPNLEERKTFKIKVLK